VLERAGGWEVVEAGNGREAVAIAKKISPNLIILDLAMPEMDGLASTREISKLMPYVPILLHTLYWSPRIAVEALKAGARKAIPKSQSNEVLAAVEELLAPRLPRLLAVLQRPPKAAMQQRSSPESGSPLESVSAEQPGGVPDVANPTVPSEKADTQAASARSLREPGGQKLDASDQNEQDPDEETRKAS